MSDMSVGQKDSVDCCFLRDRFFEEADAQAGLVQQSKLIGEVGRAIKYGPLLAGEIQNRDAAGHSFALMIFPSGQAALLIATGLWVTCVLGVSQNDNRDSVCRRRVQVLCQRVVELRRSKKRHENEGNESGRAG